MGFSLVTNWFVLLNVIKDFVSRTLFKSRKFHYCQLTLAMQVGWLQAAKECKSQGASAQFCILVLRSLVVIYCRADLDEKF